LIVEVKREMLSETYSSIGSVANRVGIPRWRLAYLIERGDVPGPSFQVPGRRLFSEEDIERILEALKTQQGGTLPPRSV
jgi:DNA-binding transcriptional MerR regulator